MAWRAGRVWESVATELRGHRQRGLAGLLTEDTVRFATARALVDAGLDPGGLRVEWPHPMLRGSRVDLATGGEPPGALMEFKFPREPNEQNAAWTMALGEVLKDLYRLAACPGEVDRLFVYIETSRLRRYMAGAADRYGLRLDVEHVVLRPDDAARLPTTAAQIIGADLAAHHVTARRIWLVDIDDTLRLAVYVVDALGAIPQAAAGLLASEESASVPPQPGPGGSSLPDTPSLSVTTPLMPTSLGSRSAVPTREGARREILQAIRALLARSGTDTFTPAHVIEEMRQRGTGYAESTIRTMVTGHMCANAPENAGTTYDDLERIERGVYRLTRRPRATDPA